MDIEIIISKVWPIVVQTKVLIIEYISLLSIMIPIVIIDLFISKEISLVLKVYIVVFRLNSIDDEIFIIKKMGNISLLFTQILSFDVTLRNFIIIFIPVFFQFFISEQIFVLFFCNIVAWLNPVYD